jgi:hypothetical protein
MNSTYWFIHRQLQEEHLKKLEQFLNDYQTEQLKLLESHHQVPHLLSIAFIIIECNIGAIEKQAATEASYSKYK